MWTDAENDWEIATGGTVKDRRWGGAFTLHSRTTLGTLQLVIPVDSVPRRTTLYRTELFGILGAVITLHHLLTATGNAWENLTGKIWCNNKAAVNKYNELCEQLLFYS